MKYTKKLLALLMIALLALTLCAPAMALSRSDITITGPEDTVPHGETITLRVDVDLPENVEIVSYQWYSQGQIDGATEAVLRIAFGDAKYPAASTPYYGTGAYYLCHITFAEKDTDGNIIDTYTLISPNIYITIEKEREINFWEILQESFMSGLGVVAMTCVMSGYFLLPLAPVTFLIGFVLGLFSWVFS